LNNQGPNGELGTALGDPDEGVRMMALSASSRINVFTHLDKVVTLISDKSASVRLRAAENLGMMRAKDSVVGLVALTSPSTEPDARVRAAAIGALGRIADPSSRGYLQAAQNDSNQFVRDAARIALRKL
jgi:HEAT repeat protein